MSGPLALVGSGEYLPSMLPLETDLFAAGVAAGRRPIYVQLATAAGLESEERLAYWRRLGEEQARRMGVEVDFIPVFDRQAAMDEGLAARAQDAALIYFSGGDPHHLAQSLWQTPLWKSVETNFRAGGALAGCSAGAMFLSAEVPSLRFLHRKPIPGMGVIPDIQVVPHYDQIHRWIPDAAVRIMTKIPKGVTLIGIDELTAVVRHDGESKVLGAGQVHILNGETPESFSSGQVIRSL